MHKSSHNKETKEKLKETKNPFFVEANEEDMRTVD